MIHRIAPDLIGKVWPAVAPLLEPAVVRAGTHALSDVRVLLETRRAQLWAQGNDRIEAAVVTEYVPFPIRPAIRVWLAGAGKGARPDWPAFERAVSEWGRAIGCKDIVIEGRKGWLRRFRGLTPHALVIRKEIV